MASRYADDEPVTPAGRLFLRPNMQQFVNCSLGLKNPIDVEATKSEILNTLVQKNPRFRSLLVVDGKGREHWRKMEVEEMDIDRHVVVVADEDVGEDVNEYVAGMTISTVPDLSKPLWEVYVIPSRRCCVLRFHHALGDGVSLMSLFLACCRRADDPSLPLQIPGRRDAKKPAPAPATASLLERAVMVVLMAWYTLVYVVEFVVRLVWVKDEETPISGGDGMELWPRKLRTVTFRLADVKDVKNSIGGTVNDVVLGVVNLALEKYLELETSMKTKKPIRITGLAMVNIRPIPGIQELTDMMKKNTKTRWGNNFGFILLPLYLWKTARDENQNALVYATRAKEMNDKKKLSLEALFSYKSGALVMALFGPKIASLLNYRIIAQTTFTISNLMGPSDEVMFAGNPITHIRTTSSGLPQAITMHMISYMDKMDLQILVAKDVIHNPDLLAKCFVDALEDMKGSVAVHTNKKDI